MGVPVAPDHQFKVPVVRRTEYTIFLEQATARHCFVHCDVHVPWTPKVRRDLIQDWRSLLALHGGPIHALHDPEDLKHLKFLRLFGFQRLASITDAAGNPQEIHQIKG